MSENSYGEPCQRCGEHCVALMMGKTSDSFFARWPGGLEQTGYVPPDDVCGVRCNDDADYMSLKLCLACGQVQGEWPKKLVLKWLERGSRPVDLDPSPRRRRKRSNGPSALPKKVFCRRCGVREIHPDEGILCAACQQHVSDINDWLDE